MDKLKKLERTASVIERDFSSEEEFIKALSLSNKDLIDLKEINYRNNLLKDETVEVSKFNHYF